MKDDLALDPGGPDRLTDPAFIGRVSDGADDEPAQVRMFRGEDGGRGQRFALAFARIDLADDADDGSASFRCPGSS